MTNGFTKKKHLPNELNELLSLSNLSGNPENENALAKI